MATSPTSSSSQASFSSPDSKSCNTRFNEATLRDSVIGLERENAATSSILPSSSPSTLAFPLFAPPPRHPFGTRERHTPRTHLVVATEHGPRASCPSLDDEIPPQRVATPCRLLPLRRHHIPSHHHHLGTPCPHHIHCTIAYYYLNCPRLPFLSSGVFNLRIMSDNGYILFYNA